jgi:type VI secretion system protein ImpE
MTAPITKAKELYAAGDIQGAIDRLIQEVKSKPTDVTSRTSLFEMLCLAGEWDRALKQLDVIGQQGPDAEMGVQVYKHNIKAARDRERLFSDGLAPHFLTEPPSYVDLHLDAINRIREGNLTQARELLDKAEEERPAFQGTIGEKEFKDFRDADDLVSSVLEVIVHDKYTWIPIEQIGRIEIEEPKNLRDTIWIPAKIETTNNTLGEVFIFALYAGSNKSEDNQIKLGRMTDWKKLSEDIYQAIGLRLFLVGDEDKAIFQLRQVQFQSNKESTENS